MHPPSDFIEKLGEIELARQDCFLCKPSELLTVDSRKDAFTMAGLGPIVDGYAIVATRDHLYRLASSSAEYMVAYADYATQIRRKLAQHYGTCILTEHGNMPICGIDVYNHSHCFHPHFLLFPNGSSIFEAAREYFQYPGHQFSTLIEALNFGKSLNHYLLVSENEDGYFVFIPDKDLPRQFARALIAEGIDALELASWRNHPGVEMTLANANELKKLFSDK